ncbi:gastrula zinc finger protein xFG20-1-like, partial [Branchiostoma floridae]|uniref:Gastrula zinc finger protein xFG20-1-like n=1 Tax=Branchiostoma floridae TaxID=7739 RepID=A0A9J7LC35_BRAFL
MAYFCKHHLCRQMMRYVSFLRQVNWSDATRSGFRCEGPINKRIIASKHQSLQRNCAVTMEEEDDDTHQCRACKMVIQGLDNYVQHRKFSCVRLAGKKSQIDEGKTCHIPVASDSASKCSDYFRVANSEEDDKVDVLSEAFTATCTDKTGPGTQNENHPGSSSFQSPISESERDDAENVHSQSLEDTEESDRLPMIMTVECVDVEDQPEEPRKIPFFLQQHTSRMDFSCKACAMEFSNTFKLKQHFASKAHHIKVGYAKKNAEKTKENGSGEGERSRSPSMAMTVDCVNDDFSSDDGCGFGPEDIEDGDRLHDEDTPDATDSASKMDTDVQDTYCDVCKYDYGYPSRLKAHLKTEKHLRVVAALGGTAQSESYCEVCQKDFWSYSKLEKHLSSKRHIQAAGKATTNTREKSNKDTTVKVGEDIKRGNEGQDTYCDICKYEYSYPSRLEAHLKTEKHLRAAAALGETVNDEDSPDATTDIPNETAGMKSETESSMQNVEESATRNQGEAVKEESNREEASKETNVDVTTERNMQNDRRVRSEKKRKKRKKKLTQIDNSDCSSAVDPDEHPEASDDNVYRKKARNNGTAPNHAKLKRKRKKYRERVKVGKKLACKYCNTDFSTASHLYKHAVRYLEKKGDHNPLYLCYPCRHVAYSSEEYEEHCKTQDHAVYQELYNHIEEKQGSYLKYSCNICEYQTPNKHEIERHVPKHLVENGKVFSCDRCEKSFHSYRGRQRHIEAVHEHKMEKTIVCEVCGKRFYNWVSCGTHMSLHKGLKPYKCTHEGCTYRGKA